MDKLSPKLNVFCALSAGLLCASVAWAGTTWDGGGGDDNWGTGNNWDDNSSPSPGSTVDLTFSGSTRLTPFNNYTAFDDFRNLIFNSSSSFNISGNALDLFGKIENSGTGSATLNIDDFSMNSGGGSEINPVSGDLTIGASGTAGQQVFNNGNTVHVFGDNGHTLTVNMDITGTGALIVEQNSIVVLNEAQTYTGNTEIDEGEIRIGSSGDISGSSSIFVGNGGTTGVDAGLKITDTDGGTTFDNAMTINAGDGTSGNRVLGSDNTSGRNTFDGNVTLNATTTLETASGGEVEFGGVLSGANGIKTSGDGTVVFTGANTYTGLTEIEAGTLKLETGGSISDSSAVTVSSGATFDLNDISDTVASIAGAGAITLGSATLTAGSDDSSTTVSGVISETGGLVKTGSGTLTLSGDNTYSGTTAIDEGEIAVETTRTTAGGTIFVGNGGTIAVGAQLSIADLDGGTEIKEAIQVNSGDGSADNRVLGANNTSGVNTFSGNIVQDGMELSTASGGTVAFTGVISDLDGSPAAVVKEGAGTVEYRGANTYTGNTEVDEGILQVNETGSIASGSSIFIGNGATTGTSAGFKINDADGGTTVSNDLTINNGDGAAGNRLIASDNTSGVNTFSGAITLNGDATFEAASGGEVEFSGVVSGSNHIIKEGAGTVTLSGNNTFTDGVFVDEGILALDNDNAAGSGTLFLGEIASANTVEVNIKSAGTTVGNNITVRDGSGTRTVGSTHTSGSSTFSGAVTLDEAVTLDAGVGGTTVFSGNFEDGVTEAGEFGVAVNAAGGTVQFSGNTANSGVSQYTVQAGTLELNKSVANGAIDDVITVNNGATLRNLQAEQIVDTVSVTIDGDWDLGNNNETIGSLAGSGNVDGGTAQLIVGENNTSTSYSGVMTGAAAGSFVKKGSGTMQLDGANTHAGETFVVGGTLQYNVTQDDLYAGDIQLGETSGSDAATVAIGVAGVELKNDLTVRSGSSGTKSLVANSAGVATFSGAVTLDDDLTVSSGAGVSAEFTGSSFDLKNQRLTLTGAGDVTINQGISTSVGTGDLLKQGSGTLTLNGANTYAGSTFIDEGVVQISEGASLNDATTVEVGSNLQITQGAQFLISDSDGGTTVNEALQSNTGNGSAGNRLIGGLNTSGENVFSGNLAHDGVELSSVLGGKVTFSGIISNLDGTPAAVIKKDAGTVEYQGANTYTGNTEVDEGILQVNETGSIAAGSSIFIGNGATTSTAAGFKINDADGGRTFGNDMTINNGNGAAGNRLIGSENTSGVNTFSGAITLNGDATFEAASGGEVEFSGVVSGSNHIIKDGAGTVTLSGNNTFTDGVFVDEGILALDNNNAAGSGSLFVGEIASANTAEVNIKSAGITIGNNIISREGSGTRTVGATHTSGSSTFSGNLTHDGVALSAAQGGEVTFSGVISDLDGSHESVRKVGDGQVNLTGISTYDQSTEIDAGILSVDGDISASSVVNANAGGTLQGIGTVGSLEIKDGGVLSPGNSVGTINAGDTVFSAGGSYLWEVTDFADAIESNNGAVDAGTDWDLLAVTGTLDLNSLTTSNPFVIDIASLAAAAGPNGYANNTDTLTDFIFNIATASGGILTGSLDLIGNDLNDYFSISQANFSNDKRPGIFSVQISGGSLQLKHLAHVPEPSTTVLFGLGGILLFRARSRRKFILS